MSVCGVSWEVHPPPNHALQRTEAGGKPCLVLHVSLRQPLSLSLSPLGAENPMSDFPLPAGLIRLIATGIWPSADGPSMTVQQSRPLVLEDRVRRFASEESLICLQPPPFHTIAQERAAGGSGDFWERFGALSQIVPEAAVIIGDFGMGSDSPIILDFARNASNPPVCRLRWGPEQRNEWVEGAPDFDAFAALLGLA